MTPRLTPRITPLRDERLGFSKIHCRAVEGRFSPNGMILFQMRSPIGAFPIITISAATSSSVASNVRARNARYDADAMKKVFSEAKDSLTNNLSTLAKATELDYIFLTTMDNISEDTKRVMLKGEVVRYDAKANQLFRHEILSYAEDIDLHIKEIKIKMIDTIPHSIHTIGRNRTYLLAGIAIILAFAIGQSFSELSRY